MYDLSVIIVNYNTVDFLVRCLNSVKSQSGPRYEVVVVDNASTDLSRETIRDRFPWVRLIANEHNVGFGPANNQALDVCTGSYLHFLNPDTELTRDALRSMVDHMESHPDVGLAGSRIINPDGSKQASVEGRYPGQKYAGAELKGLKGPIAWVLGASMVARHQAIASLGGFDERFFLYGEEQDLCLRLRQAGWEIGYIRESVVIHWGGQSERENLPQEIWAKKFEAEFAFYEKHYSSQAMRAIRRTNLIKALWRVPSLWLTLPLSSDKQRVRAKLDKYRLILKMFGAWHPGRKTS
jgi:GT2 family glycosyltransferase